MQPTAHAVGRRVETAEPQRGESCDTVRLIIPSAAAVLARIDDRTNRNLLT